MPIKIVTVTKFKKRVEIGRKMCYNNKAKINVPEFTGAKRHMHFIKKKEGEGRYEAHNC